MNPSTTDKPESPTTKGQEHEFFPSGAIVFFIALIAFFAMVWLAIYGIMIYRQGSL